MRMLSLFPQLLFLGPVSATLLRIAAGAIFLYLAYFHYQNRRPAAHELGQLVGVSMPLLYLYALIELLVAASLILGLWTQLSAVIGFGIALKIIFVRNRLKELKPLSTLSYALLALICLSLMFTGAGALAFDLPL